MRNFLLFLVLATTLVANDNYAIQVLSAKDKNSITSGFMAKVNAVSMPSRGVKGKDGYYKVYYGGIKTYMSAAVVLPYIRDNVSGDAFILKEKDVSTSVHKRQVLASAKKKPMPTKVKIPAKMKIHAKMQKRAIRPVFKGIPANAKSKMTAKQVEVAEAKSKIRSKKSEMAKAKIEAIEILGPVATASPVATPMAAVIQEERPSCEETQLYRSNRKSKRVLEIAEAIAFYDSSPHYKFNK